MKFHSLTGALICSLLGALPAGAVVPGFAGNVTGGGNVTPVAVTSLSQMQAAVDDYDGSGGLAITYSGTFDEAAILANICGQWSKPKQELSISGKNDITILGTDASKANFGIRIKGTSSNIIVRNMTIGLLPGGADNGDLIGIEADSHHVWIDHNELYTRNVKCPGTPDDDTTFDGMLDIKNRATFITVSYNYLHDHAKVGLIGSSDTDSAERRVTYAHNRYENLGSRLPFQRFGFVHSYNNYFNHITGSGINPRMGGHILVENNYFENALNPVFSQSTVLGQWDLRNNNTRSAADNATYNITWTACSGSTPCQKAQNWTTTAAFPITLPYAYTTYAPAVSKCIALTAAGSRKGLKEAVDVLATCGAAPAMLTVSPTALNFPGTGSTAVVTVAANVAWTIQNGASSIATINPLSGNGNGSFTVTVGASPGVSRGSGFTVSGGGITRDISISQDQGSPAAVVVSPTALSLPSTASTGTFLLSTNVGWTISDDQPWITVSPTAGGGNGGTISVTATANTAAASRTGTVTVTGGGPIVRTVTVTQAGAATSSIYQAESGTVGGGTVLESSNGGFNGTGYVNASTSGGFSQTTAVDGRGGGAKTLRIRYALGAAAARTGRLLVNGVATNITFNPTGAWNAWSTQDVSITLANNTSNTIRFESTGQDLANIDQIEVR